MRPWSLSCVLTAAVLAAACGSGCASGSAAAYDTVARYGGHITDFGIFGHTEVDFDVKGRRKEIRDADLVELAPALRALRPHYVDLDGADLTDAAVPHLAQLKTLTVVSLGGTRITDAGLRSLLGALPRLQQVSVDAMVITPEAIERLRRTFPGVRIVRLIDYGGGTWLAPPGEGLPER